MNNSKSSFFISSISVVTLATMLNNNLLDSNVIRYAVYFLEVICIVYIFYHIDKAIIPRFYNKFFLITSILLVLNFAFSSYEPVYVSLIKYFGYYCCFWFGVSVCETEGDIRLSKVQCLMLVFMPLFIVALWDDSPMLNMFFTNSNIFTFYGECSALLILVAYRNRKTAIAFSALVLLFYLLVGTSLGVVLALFLSILLINRKNRKLLVVTAVGFTLAVVVVLNYDLPLFVRIRNVVTVIGGLDYQDFLKIDDVNLYEINQSVDSGDGRADNNSAIWRLQHWMHLLKAYLSNIYYAFLFGLGEGYSMNKLGNTPHNDVLRIFCEYGIIVFGIWFGALKKIYKSIKGDIVAYLILSLFLYHFSENLLETFPPNAILYFCTGFMVCKVRKERFMMRNRKF